MSVKPTIATEREKTRAIFAAFNAHIAGPITLGSDGEPELVKLTLACDVDGMRRLLAAGENPNVRGRNGRPAIFWATTVFKNEVLQVLAEYGADLSITEEEHSPLLHAARIGDIAKTRILLDAGADPNTVINGHSILCHIADGQHHEAASLLIAAGADVHARSAAEDQAIHLAARSRHAQMMATLLRAGADIEAAEGSGKRPLELAIEWGHLETAKMLLEAGADLPKWADDDAYWEEILDGAEKHEEEATNAIRRLIRAAILARNLESALDDQPPSARQSSGIPSPL